MGVGEVIGLINKFIKYLAYILEVREKDEYYKQHPPEGEDK
jgi:hypothetical protein